MATTLVLKVASLAVMCMVLGCPFAEAALPCGQVQFTIAPCLGYLRRPGPSVPAPCCNGVRTLNNLAKTTPDRQGACRCLKSAYSSLPGLNAPALASLPAKCAVNLPFKPTPTINCNTKYTI
ncbi:non-specific lipid-transfer protein 1-like isoform X2 [Lotus japonicus]|uniref:non-specific lipid-transfer protein 1-like isoform X2 n=1 Tax=Lotus japonicus TaxID=34305 RepID=UPI00258903CD|nr:non-specific lipid-transfer protein 1-like isoform X2 [Lotus japonicus]